MQRHDKRSLSNPSVIRICFLVLLFQLTVSGFVLKAVKTSMKQAQCNMENPLIQYLEEQGVQVFSFPHDDSSNCPKEWGKYGTCCQEWTLRTYVNKKLLANSMALESLNGEIQGVIKKISTFTLVHLNHTLDLNIHLQGKTMGNGLQFVTALVNLTSLEDSQKQRLQTLEEIHKNLSSYTPGSMLRQKKCVEQINKVIASSTCSICSGRSDHFFLANKRLKISESLCRSVLAECTDAWNDMIYIAAQVRKYTNTVRRLSSFSDEDSNMEERAFIMNLEGFVSSRKIKDIIRVCGSNDLENCSFRHVSKLCEQFIHIKSPTYVESALSRSKKLVNIVLVTQSGLEKVRPLFKEKLVVLSKMADREQNQKWLKQALRLISVVQRRTIFLKDAWIILKHKQPLMESILKSSKKKHPELIAAIHTARNESDIIIEDFASATLKIHTVLRKAIERTRNLKKVLKQFMVQWSIFCQMANHLRNPSVSGAESKQFYQNLKEAMFSKRQSVLRFSSPTTRTLLYFFEKAVKSKMSEILENESTQSRKLEFSHHSNLNLKYTPRILDGEGSNCPVQGSTQPTPLILLRQEHDQIDVNVIKDTQCNPCVGLTFEFHA